jgi:hypothetical protein
MAISPLDQGLLMRTSFRLAASLPLVWLLASCQPTPTPEILTSPTPAAINRTGALPLDAVKQQPADDDHPPQLHADEWADPIPLPGPINTAGAEDSPFISVDGKLLFFFFTPDVRVPAEKQLLDGVTGIYLSQIDANGPTIPTRLQLQEPGKLALDGCPYFDESQLWFCSAREGYTGLHWFKASLVDGHPQSWMPTAFDQAQQVGELHIFEDELYFHSDRKDGIGGRDLWLSRYQEGEWQPAENLRSLNSPGDEGYPFITSDGNQIWFTRILEGIPAIYRALRTETGWNPPELIVSRFAGEPTLDPEGNLYFVHHYFEDGVMLEADIYVAYRQK